MQTRVTIKGETREGTLIADEEICKHHGVRKIFKGDDGYFLYDNFDRWEAKDGILDLYAKPRKNRPTVVKGDSFLFIG